MGKNLTVVASFQLGIEMEFQRTYISCLQYLCVGLLKQYILDWLLMEEEQETTW